MVLSTKRLRKKRLWRKLSIDRSRSYCKKRSKWSIKAHTSVGKDAALTTGAHVRIAWLYFAAVVDVDKASLLGQAPLSSLRNEA